MSDNSLTLAQLRDIVAETFEVEVEALLAAARFDELETYDSVTLLTLMVSLDEQAGIAVPPHQLSELNGMDDILALAKDQGVTISE